MPRSVIAIVAVDPNLAIGRDNEIPWHHSADLRFFKEATTGNTIVMGRRTHESLGRALPNRRNLVVTRQDGYQPADGALVCRDADEALRLGDPASDLYVIGGAQIYELFAPRIDEWLVTRVPEIAAGADTFMAADFLDGYRKVDEVELGGGLRVERFVRASEGG